MTLTLPSDREIVMTRLFDAPRRLVFEALTWADLIRSGGATRGERDRMLHSGMQSGASESMDQLEELLHGLR